MVVIVLAAFTAVDQLEPFHRQFSVKDVTIQHPFAKQETVPTWLLLVLCMPCLSLLATTRPCFLIHTFSHVTSWH